MNHKLKYLLTAFCLILLTMPACTRNSTGSGSGGSSLPGGSGGGNNVGTTTAAAISENDKPLDVMTKAVRAQLDAKSYRAHVITTLADGVSNEMMIEYVAPDSYRMTQSGKGGEAAGGDYKMESVIVGGTMYMKMPNGQWVKSPINASGIIKSFRDPKMLDELTKAADVKFVGPDTIDGAPMLVYQYTQNNPMGMNLKNTAKTWLSVADGLPRKTESEGEFEGKKTKTLVTMSDYNADIKIESPVK